MIHNRAVFKSRRKELRNHSTPAEKLLWHKLRQRTLGGYKFRRQHSVGPYILDFYCPAARLAVELDGDYHLTAETMKYDYERTVYLNGMNIRVIRFSNTDVYDNLNVVCERILVQIKNENLPPTALGRLGQ
jgi:very-short-patch-repair endonuclease